MSPRGCIRNPHAASRCGRSACLVSSALIVLAFPAVARAQAPVQASTTIAEARLDSDGDGRPDRRGDTLTVAGRVTAGTVLSAPDYRFALQDASAGILVRGRAEDVEANQWPAVRSGDSVQVKGRIGWYNGQTQLEPARVRVVPAPRAMPPPRVLPETDGFESFEGSLVRVRAWVKGSSENRGGVFLLIGPHDAREAVLAVFVPHKLASAMNLDRFTVGDEVRVTGVLGQYDAEPPYDDFYQIYPRSAGDLRAVGLPRQLLRNLALVGGAVLLFAILWLYVLRLQVRSRTRELRASEEQLAAWRQRVSVLLHHTPLALWSVDRNLRVTGGEGRGLTELGLSGDNFVGRNMRDVLGITDPEDPAIVANQAALAGESRSFDIDFGGRTWEVRLEPLRDGDDIVGVAGAAMDVSQHREIEQRLEEQTQYFRSLFEEAPEAVVLVDENDMLLQVNPEFERMFGYTASEAIGQPINDLISIPGREEEASEITRQVASGRRVEVEAFRRRRDGSHIQVSILAKPVEVGGGRRVYGIYRDITEQKDLETKLLHSQRLEAVGHLAGGIAHDFNNILTVILGHARLLLENEVQPADPREDVRQIAKAAERAARLTSQLLTFSRREMVTSARIDLNGVIRDLEDMLYRLIEEHVTITMELAPDVPTVIADAGQLQQIVMNLVINSRDAMPDGGNVVVRTRAETLDGRLTAVLEVSDEGTGMTEEEKARMFEPFFTTKRSGQGTGLGLSTVYGIVERWGGSIGVESELGKGTAITVWFPAAPAEPSAPGVEDRQAAGEPQTDNGSDALILLVDDDSAVREVTRRILQRAGFQVVTRDSGAAALEYCEAGDGVPDLVLTDIVMPGISGIALARRLRERMPHVPVLLMSGYADFGDSDLDDLNEVIHKPFDSRTLVRRVRERLGSR